MRRVCVFCGSSAGARPEYVSAARELGAAIAGRGLGLVYGGGRVGLMHEVALAALEQGGEVIGVIPEDLVRREVAFTALRDLRVVLSMHERKALMAELADAFIAMPGGLGTVEEFVEALTWGQLGLHRKACGLLNVCGYFDGLVSWLDHAVSERFVTPEHRTAILIDEVPDRLMARLLTHQPPVFDKAVWARVLAASREDPGPA